MVVEELEELQPEDFLKPYNCPLDSPAAVYQVSTVTVGEDDPGDMATVIRDFQECSWLDVEAESIFDQLSYFDRDQVAQIPVLLSCEVVFAVALVRTDWV